MRNIAYIAWLLSVATIMGLLAYGTHTYGMAFTLGLLSGTVITQLAVYVRYGEWF